MTDDRYEKESRNIFGGLREVDPPPFMAARISARLKSGRQAARKTAVIRWLAGLSSAGVLSAGLYFWLQPCSEIFVTNQPYVIQVDFAEPEYVSAESAEIELPDGVSFVSKNEGVQALRKLRLPISKIKQGRLPFVVLSKRAGRMPLLVRVYGGDGRISAKTLTVHFRDGKGQS